MTTKGAARPLSPRGVWGMPPPEKFEIQKLGNAIFSVLGIKKRAVFVAFKSFSGHRCC